MLLKKVRSQKKVRIPVQTSLQVQGVLRSIRRMLLKKVRSQKKDRFPVQTSLQVQGALKRMLLKKMSFLQSLLQTSLQSQEKGFDLQ